jgi:GTP-binding protein YchF
MSLAKQPAWVAFFLSIGRQEMQIGIIGLPNSTKTTIFNALTHSQVETATFSTGRVETHTATVRVPDPRIDRLSAMFEPRKTTYAQIQYNDITGLRVGIGDEGGLSGPLLNAVAQVDAFLHVVRAFEDENVPHPGGPVDPAGDLAAMDFELLFSDLVIVERSMERLAQQLSKKRAYPERQADETLLSLLMRLKEALEREAPIRDLALTREEMTMIRGYQFLTGKPVLVVLNVGDEGSDDPGDYLDYQHRQSEVICLRGGLEMEIAELDEDEAELFLQEYGISEPGLHRMIRLSYRLLGLHSFFTVGEDEVRSWTIPVGATALEAAGAIHSDLARGFIRAEVVSYDDLIAAGSLDAARKRGTLRLQGRDYVVQDGDILNIRFNV